jgi:hypothetical protein
MHKVAFAVALTIALAISAFAQEFVVPGRATDILGITLGMPKSTVVSSLSKYKMTEGKQKISGVYVDVQQFSMAAPTYSDQVSIKYSAEKQVTNIVRRIAYRPEQRPSIDNWADPILAKYGQYSYNENGPGYTNLFWDYIDGGQILEKSNDAQFRIIVKLAYDAGRVHSVSFEITARQTGSTGSEKSPGDVPL